MYLNFIYMIYLNLLLELTFIIRPSSKRKERDKEKSDYVHIVIAKYARYDNCWSGNHRTLTAIKRTIWKLSKAISIYRYNYIL